MYVYIYTHIVCVCICAYILVYKYCAQLDSADLQLDFLGSFGCRFPHWAFEKNSHAAMLMLRYLLDHKARTHKSLGFLGVSGCCWRFGLSTNGSRDHHHHFPTRGPFSNTLIFWIIMY